MRVYSLLSWPDYPNSYVDDPFAFVELTRDSQPFLMAISYWNGSPEAALDQIATQVALQPGRYSLCAYSRLAQILYFQAPGLMQSSAGFSLEIVPVSCPGDTDRDSDVDVQDLTAVLARQGPLHFGNDADLTGDGQVDIEDLTIVLANFGAACGE
jgi:hypothetical protein